MERYATGIKKPENMMPIKSVYSREKRRNPMGCVQSTYGVRYVHYAMDTRGS